MKELPDELTVNGVKYVKKTNSPDKCCRTCDNFDPNEEASEYYAGSGDSFCYGYEINTYASDVRGCWMPKKDRK